MTVGVEEEFLLVDSASGGTAARAPSVLGRLRPADGTGPRFHRELLSTQVESATGVCTGLGELRRAAGHLEFIAADIAAGVIGAAVTEADAIVTGIGRLLVELRANREHLSAVARTNCGHAGLKEGEQ